MLGLNHQKFTKMSVTIDLTNITFLHPEMFCDKFDWKWPSGCGEDKKVYKDDNNNDEQRTKFDQENVTWGFD